MNKPTYLAIQEHSYDSSALVFVSSRRQTRLTAMVCHYLLMQSSFALPHSSQECDPRYVPEDDKHDKGGGGWPISLQDLISLAASDERSKSYLQCPEEEMALYLETVRFLLLAFFLQFRVGMVDDPVEELDVSCVGA